MRIGGVCGVETIQRLERQLQEAAGNASDLSCAGGGVGDDTSCGTAV